MYLRINEQRYAVSFDENSNELDIYYNNIDSSAQNNQLKIIDGYVCLFDDDWKTVNEVWDYLQSRLYVKRLAFNTVATKGQDLKLFYDFLSSYKLTYSSLNHKIINDFIAWLMIPSKDSDLMQLSSSSKRSAKTVNRIISTIRDFYKYHEAVNNIDNPFKHDFETIKRPTRQNKSFYAHTQNGLVQKSTLKIKEFDEGVRVLSKEQIELIQKACKVERDRLLFELLLFTGMRIGEALSLDIHSIGVAKIGSSVEELKMKPNNDDHSKGNQERQQKTGTRELFIPSLLMEKLSDYYENTWMKIYEKKEMTHEYFFISEFHNNLGEPLSYQAVWNRCRKIGKETGVFFSPHDFRHTFATALARNKVGIHKLRKLLGHRHIASTDVYMHIANKEEIVEELIPFYKSYGVDI
ncbi:tyrosine-type recombinase/integrase [Sulfurimonas sp.]|uniref:tyrosine-type recombinase/integrase n=1 Tax=Sulfurimonas sp. TaxID=2022749 RepID=UPI0025EFA7A1|nr:tyrosine-type recombinase/integrase [Sulfurimonas sp.]